jgi:hypothetical protein
MSRYRRFVLTSLSIAAAVLLLQRCGSNEAAARRDQSGLGQGDICNNVERRGEENLCNDNGSERCGSGDGEHDNCVSFCRDIQPIFDNRCIRCHNPVMHTGSLDLTTGNSYANLVNQPTSAGCMAQVPDSVRVVPCDPPASMLWRKTMPDDSRCGRPMPLGTAGLGVIAPDEFALIENWIAQGAQSN